MAGPITVFLVSVAWGLVGYAGLKLGVADFSPLLYGFAWIVAYVGIFLSSAC